MFAVLRQGIKMQLKNDKITHYLWANSFRYYTKTIRLYASF